MNIGKKRLFASTGLTFIVWSIGSSVILFSIAIIFLRGQVRPILNLANAARQIGFGRDVKNYNIEGATEVRLAGRAFQAMRHRIKKQITERMELLAGVSHDLRTPITRMKLQLELLNENSNLKNNLGEDLDEMEEMIKGYLEFAKDDREEEMVEANLFKIVQLAAKSSDPSLNKIEISPPSYDLPIFPMQVRSINRALINLLNNAIKYAGKAKISTRLFDDHCEVVIDDNLSLIHI